MPPTTMDAFRDHGAVTPPITDERCAEAEHDLAEALGLGLDLDGVTKTLVAEGVELFADAFDNRSSLLSARLEFESRQMAGADLMQTRRDRDWAAWAATSPAG